MTGKENYSHSPKESFISGLIGSSREGFRRILDLVDNASVVVGSGMVVYGLAAQSPLVAPGLMLVGWGLVGKYIINPMVGGRQNVRV